MFPPPIPSAIAQTPPDGALERVLDDLPAWIVSLVVHMVAVLLAGMWFVGPPKEDRGITLSTSVSDAHVKPDLGALDGQVLQLPEFDDSGGTGLQSLASLDPPDRIDVTVPGPLSADRLPASPEATMAQPSDSAPMVALSGALAGRDPRHRQELLRREGGTSATEAAVARGLAWLARHQNADGRWSLHAFHLAPGASGDADGLGQESDTAGTALALLPFLGAGQTHQEGQYAPVVGRGLKWLVDQQRPDGDLRGVGIGRMYAHGQAAIALCEAYALTKDPQLRQPAQAALDFIVRAQHRAGGWRYSPGEPGDTSVFGWQLMALRSGRMAYLAVPQATFQLASRYLNRAKADRAGGLYGYMPGHRPSPAMTAEALLCRQYLGWPRDHPGLQAGVRYLVKDYLPREETPDIYYWYYATQVMHHMGGRAWELWNRAIRSVLVTMQRTDGDQAGSWDPRGPFAQEGGRLYMTSLAICTLEVYYRYLPMYRTQAVDEERDEGKGAGEKEGKQ